MFSATHCAYNIIVNVRTITDWLNIKRGSTNLFSNAMENDPQTAWKIINELKNVHYLQIKQKKNNRTLWFTHVRDLLRSNTHQIDSDRQKNIKEELNQYEKSPQYGNLDYEITENHIVDA